MARVNEAARSFARYPHVYPPVEPQMWKRLWTNLFKRYKRFLKREKYKNRLKRDKIVPQIPRSETDRWLMMALSKLNNLTSYILYYCLCILYYITLHCPSICEYVFHHKAEAVWQSDDISLLYGSDTCMVC